MSFDAKAYYKQYNEKRREKQKAYMALYYENNKEKFRISARNSRERNREKTKAREARWKAENAARYKETKHRWYEKNKDKESYKARIAETSRMWNETPRGRAKKCASSKKYNAAHPQKVQKRKMDWHYRSKYGITVAERDRLFEEQGKRCRLCRSDSSSRKGFHVDHCHATQKIRGIVCHSCNLLLGHSRDSIAILEAAIAYLKGSK